MYGNSNRYNYLYSYGQKEDYGRKLYIFPPASTPTSSSTGLPRYQRTRATYSNGHAEADHDCSTTTTTENGSDASHDATDSEHNHHQQQEERLQRLQSLLKTERQSCREHEDTILSLRRVLDEHERRLHHMDGVTSGSSRGSTPDFVRASPTQKLLDQISRLQGQKSEMMLKVLEYEKSLAAVGIDPKEITIPPEPVTNGDVTNTAQPVSNGEVFDHPNDVTKGPQTSHPSDGSSATDTEKELEKANRARVTLDLELRKLQEEKSQLLEQLAAMKISSNVASAATPPRQTTATPGTTPNTTDTPVTPESIKARLSALQQRRANQQTSSVATTATSHDHEIQVPSDAVIKARLSALQQLRTNQETTTATIATASDFMDPQVTTDDMIKARLSALQQKRANQETATSILTSTASDFIDPQVTTDEMIKARLFALQQKRANQETATVIPSELTSSNPDLPVAPDAIKARLSALQHRRANPPDVALSLPQRLSESEPGAVQLRESLDIMVRSTMDQNTQTDLDCAPTDQNVCENCLEVSSLLPAPAEPNNCDKCQELARLLPEMAALKTELTARNQQVEDLEARFAAQREQESRAATEAEQRLRTEKDAELLLLRDALGSTKEAMRTIHGEFLELKHAHTALRGSVREMLEGGGVEQLQIQRKVTQTMSQICRSQDELTGRYLKEMRLRRKYHNQLVELRGNIRVLGRVRPWITEDGLDLHEAVVTVDLDDEGLVKVNSKGRRQHFDLDKVFGMESTQSEVFEEVSSLVRSTIDGYNVCIFAYGQTGAGKTYTMEGPDNNPGINQRALQLLFQETEETDWEYNITSSVLEIYNENIRDLLNPDPNNKLEIKMRPEGGLHVPGLVEETVTSLDEINQVFAAGRENRVTESTSMNERSSRSHCLLCVTVRGRNPTTGSRSTGRLNLVDLAGSERLSKTHADGERLKEARSINRSLACLGDVMNALRTRQPHVPYRNSKLTYLLQDSLGGDSKTLMIVQVAPGDKNVGETLCTLTFGQRVRAVELGQASKHTETNQGTPNSKSSRRPANLNLSFSSTGSASPSPCPSPSPSPVPYASPAPSPTPSLERRRKLPTPASVTRKASIRSTSSLSSPCPSPSPSPTPSPTPHSKSPGHPSFTLQHKWTSTPSLTSRTTTTARRNSKSPSKTNTVVSIPPAKRMATRTPPPTGTSFVPLSVCPGSPLSISPSVSPSSTPTTSRSPSPNATPTTSQTTTPTTTPTSTPKASPSPTRKASTLKPAASTTKSSNIVSRKNGLVSRKVTRSSTNLSQTRTASASSSSGRWK